MGASHLSDAEAFWVNSSVRAATSMHINEQREQETQQRGSNRPDVPEHARQDMVDQQKNRNKQATSMLQAGQNAPSHGGQEDVLNEFDDDWERDSRKPGEL